MILINLCEMFHMVTSGFDSSVPCADANPFECYSRKHILHIIVLTLPQVSSIAMSTVISCGNGNISLLSYEDYAKGKDVKASNFIKYPCRYECSQVIICVEWEGTKKATQDPLPHRQHHRKAEQIWLTQGTFSNSIEFLTFFFFR